MIRRVVLVTGAGRGIGAAICRHMATTCDLLIHYNRSAEAAKALAADLSTQCKALTFQADVSQPEQVAAMFAACKQEFGKLDVLVNNASYSSLLGWNVAPQNLNWEEWHKTIDIDLKGTMLCSHAAYNLMMAQKSGKIINFSSAAALLGDVPTYLYTAAKSAIVALTRTLARAYAPDIQVNCVAPGSIATDWIEKWKLTPTDLQSIVEETPLRRIGKPEEVAELVAFLASSTCTFITGQTFAIDGGILML